MTLTLTLNLGTQVVLVMQFGTSKAKIKHGRFSRRLRSFFQGGRNVRAAQPMDVHDVQPQNESQMADEHERATTSSDPKSLDNTTMGIADTLPEYHAGDNGLRERNFYSSDTKNERLSISSSISLSQDTLSNSHFPGTKSLISTTKLLPSLLKDSFEPHSATPNAGMKPSENFQRHCFLLKGREGTSAAQPIDEPASISSNNATMGMARTSPMDRGGLLEDNHGTDDPKDELISPEQLKFTEAISKTIAKELAPLIANRDQTAVRPTLYRGSKDGTVEEWLLVMKRYL